MKWNHITDCQPKDDDLIVHLSPPYKGCFSIGTRNYVQRCTWQEYLDWCKDNNLPTPDFWWIHVKDFPLPFKLDENV